MGSTKRISPAELDSAASDAAAFLPGYAATVVSSERGPTERRRSAENGFNEATITPLVAYEVMRLAVRDRLRQIAEERGVSPQEAVQIFLAQETNIVMVAAHNVFDRSLEEPLNI